MGLRSIPNPNPQSENDELSNEELEAVAGGKRNPFQPSPARMAAINSGIQQMGSLVPGVGRNTSLTEKIAAAATVFGAITPTSLGGLAATETAVGLNKLNGNDQQNMLIMNPWGQ